MSDHSGYPVYGDNYDVEVFHDRNRRQTMRVAICDENPGEFAEWLCREWSASSLETIEIWEKKMNDSLNPSLLCHVLDHFARVGRGPWSVKTIVLQLVAARRSDDQLERQTMESIARFLVAFPGLRNLCVEGEPQNSIGVTIDAVLLRALVEQTQNLQHVSLCNCAIHNAQAMNALVHLVTTPNSLRELVLENVDATAAFPATPFVPHNNPRTTKKPPSLTLQRTVSEGHSLVANILTNAICEARTTLQSLTLYNDQTAPTPPLLWLSLQQNRLTLQELDVRQCHACRELLAGLAQALRGNTSLAKLAIPSIRGLALSYGAFRDLLQAMESPQPQTLRDLFDCKSPDNNNHNKTLDSLRIGELCRFSLDTLRRSLPYLSLSTLQIDRVHFDAGLVGGLAQESLHYQGMQPLKEGLCDNLTIQHVVFLTRETEGCIQHRVRQDVREHCRRTSKWNSEYVNIIRNEENLPPCMEPWLLYHMDRRGRLFEFIQQRPDVVIKNRLPSPVT